MSNTTAFLAAGLLQACSGKQWTAECRSRENLEQEARAEEPVAAGWGIRRGVSQGRAKPMRWSGMAPDESERGSALVATTMEWAGRATAEMAATEALSHRNWCNKSWAKPSWIINDFFYAIVCDDTAIAHSSFKLQPCEISQLIT
jgi:hypothetical protein